MKEMITKLQGQIKALESIRENGNLSFDERHVIMSIEIDLEDIVINLEKVKGKNNILIEQHVIQEINRLFMEQDLNIYNMMNVK